MNSTMLDLLNEQAEKLCAHGVHLIETYSNIHPANNPGDSLTYISGSGDHFWDELPPKGKVLQAKLLPEIDRFTELVSTLMLALPQSAQDELIDQLKLIRGAVEQDYATWWKSQTEAQTKFKEKFIRIHQILQGFFKQELDVVYVFPDTNALFRNPQIDKWQFENIKRFTLIFAPTILTELDAHKINHRNPDVREKAEKLTRQLKEYRRRGSLHTGVSIVKNAIDLRWIGYEPDMSKTFSWFESSNADDRFLATFVDFVRNNLSAVSFIVTDDTNMLNKADYASIPSRDVPLTCSP